MSNYGPYFEFRISPIPEHRLGRFLSPAALIPIGSPARATTTVNADGRGVLALATGHTAPLPGKHGLAVYEWAYNAYAGLDPALIGPSSKVFADIPVSAPVQLVHGTEVKVVLRNLAADSGFFIPQQEDQTRVFVAPANLSSLAVGDLLCPGTGNGTAGYWAEVAGGQEADAWLIVTSIDTARGEVEAQMLF